MKQFQFKLQTVLDYRSEQLDQVQQVLANEENKRQKCLNRLQEIDLAIEQCFQEQRKMLEGAGTTLNPDYLQTFPHYLLRLKNDRFQAYQALLAQDRRLLQIREELKQALIKKKSLELLKEKQQKAFLKTIEKAEAAFLDELALQQKYRKRSLTPILKKERE